MMSELIHLIDYIKESMTYKETGFGEVSNFQLNVEKFGKQ